MVNRQDILEDLRRLVGQILPSESDSQEPDALIERGLDSVAMVDLLAAIEDHFRISVPPADISPANFSTIPALAHLVARLINSCAERLAPSP